MPSWEPLGAAAVKRYRSYKRAPVFSHAEFLLHLANALGNQISDRSWYTQILIQYFKIIPHFSWWSLRDIPKFIPKLNRLKEGLVTMLEDAERNETNVLRSHPDIDLKQPSVLLCSVEEAQCCVCNTFCYMSAVTCICAAKFVCAFHVSDGCSCPDKNKTLHIRHDLSVLKNLKMQCGDSPSTL